MNNEFVKNWIIRIVYIVVFIACTVCIVLGQKHIGLPGIGVMLLGLAGILTILFLYNKKYQ